MFERLQVYFYSEPGRVSGLGKAVLNIAFFFFCAGLFGWLAVTVEEVVLGMASHSQGRKPLADLYPSLPTWWVPETWFGLFVVAILMVSGVWLILTGRKIDRLHQPG